MKIIYSKIALTIFAAFLICSCSPKESVIKNQIVGEWIIEEVDNKEVLTDDIFYCSYLNGGKEIYAAGFTKSENNKFWAEAEYSYSVKGNTVTITGNDVLGNHTQMDLKIKEIDKDEMSYKVAGSNTLYKLERIEGNFYKNAILGKWEGRNVTPGVSGKDTEFHQWEYFADGTYTYYYKNANGEWETKKDNDGNYYIYGDILASTWINDYVSATLGTMYECWEIEIEGDVMNWSARRSNDTKVYFTMKKVQ